MRQVLLLAASILLLLPMLADGPAPSPGIRHYEVKFMTDMIDHHAMAIMMSEACLEKATHEQLKSMCQDIIETQSAEIQTMQAWLHHWYSMTYEPEVMMTGQMKKLISMSGEMFEIEFMQMMIRHHFQAVKEGEHCLAKAYHAELKQLCQNMVFTQMQEIQTMQSWLCNWYQICNWGPKLHER